MRNNPEAGRYRLISKILNSIYPSTCPICKNNSDSYSLSPICLKCWAGIEKYSGPSCKICATPLVSEYSIICGDCTKDEPYFSKVLNYGTYSGTLAEAIHQMKFYGVKRLAKPLGRLILDLDIPECDAIVPVPLSKKSLRERGFNQTLLMSGFLSKEMKIPLGMEMLFKIKDTPPQIGLGAKDRAKNVKGAFQARCEIKGLRLLLIDDVMTTGATARECSRTLIKAGAKEVFVATLARARMD